MPKRRRLMMNVIIFFLLMLTITACGSAAAANDKPKPTPTPIPMVRITVQLVDVFCNHKQNALGYHDSFYMMTTFAAPGSNPKARPDTQALLSLPLDITDGQDLNLPQQYLLVFDSLVPLQGSIRGGFTAYNDKNGLTWSNINLWTSEIAKQVGDQLLEDSVDSESLQVTAASAVLDLGVNVWYEIAQMTKDNSNQLGLQNLVVSASGPPSQDGVLNFHHDGGLGGFGQWDYTVRYHITRTPVTA